MKFEIGKFYKTRDGRKAQMLFIVNGTSILLDPQAELIEECKDPEPAKQRKLYAYKDYSFIFFRETDEPSELRRPEYDIFYPIYYGHDPILRQCERCGAYEYRKNPKDI